MCLLLIDLSGKKGKNRAVLFREGERKGGHNVEEGGGHCYLSLECVCAFQG